MSVRIQEDGTPRLLEDGTTRVDEFGGANEWVFRLTVTDDGGATHSTLVTVLVDESVEGPTLYWLGVGAVRPWVGAGSDTWRGVARV